MKSASYNISQVENACHVLDCFFKSGAALSSVQIQKELGMSANMAFRTLTTLVNCGYLNYNPETEKYSVSIRILPLCNIVLNSLDVRRIALPLLHNIHEQYPQMNISLAMIDGGDDMFRIHRFGSSESGRYAFNPGDWISPHATALGKALLMGKTEAELDEFLENYELKKYTETTITSKQVLKEELKQAKTDGFTWCRSERFENVNSIAAPVRDRTGNVIASISLGSFETILGLQELEGFRSRLLSVAGSISYALGYLGV